MTKQVKTIKVETLIKRYISTRTAYHRWLKRESESGKMHQSTDRLVAKMDILESILADAGYDKEYLLACYVQATEKTQASIS